jgi:hypothetical protein
VLQNNPTDVRETAPRRARRYEPKQRLRTVGELDQRTHAARRIAALVSMWEQQLGGKLTTGQRIALERAASLCALAEDARARRLSGDLSISLQDCVRLDNSAARAVAALNLPAESEREPDSGLKPLRWP